MGKKIAFGLIALGAAISLILLFVVFQGPKTELPESPKVVIIGLDGAGWNLINPLLEEGFLPNFRHLMEEGSTGVLKTARPVKSSVIWTSIATGKTMIKHGVLDWSYINRNNIEVPYRQSERRAKTFWNILGDMGWKVGIINWFITYPPEEVNGYMVSEEFRHLGSRDFTDVAVTYPEMLLKKIEFVTLKKQDFKSILEKEGLPLFEKSKTDGEQKSNLAPFYRNFIFQDKTIESVSYYLYQRFPVDVYATYFRLIDTVSHFACGYIDEDLLARGIEEEERGKITRETLAIIDKDFSRVMKPFYDYADRILGNFLGMIDPQTTLLVVSDHSFGYDNGGYGHVKMPEIPHGIILINGPQIKRNYTIRDASIYDIVPTLLYLYDMPVGKDMDGRVLTEALDEQLLKQRPVRSIPSYEDEMRVKQLKRDRKLDEKQLEEFRALGYIEDKK